MNKKLILLMIVMFGIALQSMAQEPFTVKKPPFRKFVRLNDGVNLRKSPSANSPRLVLREENAEVDYVTTGVWLNRALKKNERAARATILPIWEQSFMPTIKAADGWLCGYYPYNYGHGYADEKFVYVMEKFCEPVSLRPLSEDEDVNSFSDLHDLVVIKSGKYKDYCIATSDDGELTYLNLGKYVDGMFIFNYSVRYDYPYNSGKTESSWEKDSYGEGSWYFAYSEKIKKEEEGDIDLHKLVRDQTSMDILMKKAVNWAKKISFPTYYYYGVEGDKEWHYISLEK